VTEIAALDQNSVAANAPGSSEAECWRSGTRQNNTGIADTRRMKDRRVVFTGPAEHTDDDAGKRESNDLG